MVTVITVGRFYMKVKFIWEGSQFDHYDEEIVELSDECTDAEIQAEWYNWAAQNVAGSWERLND